MTPILWFAVVIGGVVGIILALLVLALWRQANRLSVYQHPIMFVVGMIPVLAGYLVWAGGVQWWQGRIDPLDAFLAFCIILGIAGLCDMAAYGWKRMEHAAEVEDVEHPRRRKG